MAKADAATPVIAILAGTIHATCARGHAGTGCLVESIIPQFHRPAIDCMATAAAPTPLQGME